MNLFQSLTLSASVVAASVASAQDATTASVTTEATPAVENSGLLGKRYVAASFSVVDLNNSGNEVYGIGASINLPVASNIDVAVSASHDWLHQNDDLHSEDVAVSATYFIERGAFRPYVSGLIGYSDVSHPFLSVKDFGFAGARVGTEYLLCEKTSLDVGVGYVDSFESGDNSSWSGGVQLNYWLSTELTVGGQISMLEYGDVAYTLGAAWVF